MVSELCWPANPVSPGPVLEDGRPRGLPLDDSGAEKRNAGWTLAVDNDMIGTSGSDHDYTGGAAVTFAGSRVRDWPFSLGFAADWFSKLAFDHERVYPLHALQIGLLAFTPDDLNATRPITDDRPYASLLFLSNSTTLVRGPLEPVDSTTFSFGVLGLPLAGAIQEFIHEENDLNEVPEGWEHQISNGGEPTLRISWARQSLLASNFQRAATEYELKWARQASVGYQTEAAVSVSGRWGRINTPWWSFTPDRAEYVSEPAPVIGSSTRPGARELYLWAGAKVRLRAYNAFLQGQFRSSEVEVEADGIERWVAEAWVGITWQFAPRWRVSYVLRHQTPELKGGAGDRSLTWGGLILSRDR